MCIPGRESVGNPATGLLQGRKAERCKATFVQAHTNSRSFPYFNESDRAGMYGEIHQARPAVPRIKDYRPFLDCNDCIGGYNNYNAKNKIE